MKKIIILSFIFTFLITPGLVFAAKDKNPNLFIQKISLFFTFSPEKKVQKILEFSEDDLLTYESEVDDFKKLSIKRKVEERMTKLDKYTNNLDVEFNTLVNDRVSVIKESLSKSKENSPQEIKPTEDILDTNQDISLKSEKKINSSIVKIEQDSLESKTLAIENVKSSVKNLTREQKEAQDKIAGLTEYYGKIQYQMNDINDEIEDLNKDYNLYKSDIDQKIIDRQKKYLEDLQKVNNAPGMSIVQANAMKAEINRKYEYDISLLEIEAQQAGLDYQNTYKKFSSEFKDLELKLQDINWKIEQQKIILNKI